jgi:hypothetical protein
VIEMTNVIYVGTCPVTEALIAKLPKGEAPPNVIDDRENPFFGHEVFRHTNARGVGSAVRISCVLCTTHNDFWVRNQMLFQTDYEAYQRARHRKPLPVQHPDKPHKLSPHICRAHGESEYRYNDGARCIHCRPVPMQEYEAHLKTLESV